jgi:hypothetical protein
MGSAGESACRAITLLQLVMLNADYLLVNTLSLAAVAPGVTLCRPTCVRAERLGRSLLSHEK